MSYALELTIQSKEKSANLNLKSASQIDRTNSIHLLASFFEAELKEQKIEEATLTITKKIPVEEDKKEKKTEPIIRLFEPAKELRNPSRQLPLLHSERSDIVSVGEKLQAAVQQKEEEPEYYKTGIKIDADGTKRYKCRYTCSCGKQGNHYIPLKTQEVPCFECKEPLEVTLAAGEVDPLGVPVRDNFGNFYVANPYE